MYILQKFQTYLLGGNKIARLQAKNDSIQKAMGDGTNGSSGVLR